MREHKSQNSKTWKYHQGHILGLVFPSFRWVIFGHVKSLGQSRARKNISRIIVLSISGFVVFWKYTPELEK